MKNYSKKPLKQNPTFGTIKELAVTKRVGSAGRILLLLLAVIFSFAIVSSTLAQELINVDVVSSQNGGPLPVYNGQGVLGSPSDTYWNPLSDGGITSLTGLTNSVGVATSVGMTITPPTGSSWSNTGGLPTSINLLADYLFNGNAGGYFTITLTGLDPASTYNLVSYSTGDGAGQGAAYQGALTGSTSPTTRTSFVINNNYVQNPVVAPDNTGKISFTISNNVFVAFNGLQIQKLVPNHHAPTISTNPVSQRVRQGLSVNLTVVADSGSQIPYYQWYFGASPIAGATNPTLTFASIQAANAGNYTVVVTNLSGSVTSSPPATLTVDTTTSTSFFYGGDIGQGLDLQGGNFEVAEYFSSTDFGPLLIQNATFTNNPGGTDAANLSFGAAAPNFGADQSNVNLSEIANNWAESGGANTPMNLSVPTVNGETYKLQLLFHDGFNTGAGQRQLSVTVGTETLESSLDVAGQGAGGANPNGIVLSYFFTGTGGSLPIVIQNIAPNGFAMLNALTLQHLPASPQVPYFPLAPQNQIAQQGGAVTFSALAGGSIPPFSYQWYFGSNLITGATNTTYTFANMQSTNTGTYSVVARNSAGSATNSATLGINNNITQGISWGPAPGQGMILQGNFVLAEHYGNASPDLPISGVDFVYSTRTHPNGGSGTPPNFGPFSDQVNLGAISGNNAWGVTDFTIPTTAGIHYRLQIILHDNFGGTANVGQRVFSINAIVGGVTNILANNIDMATYGATITNPTNVVITFLFIGDGGNLEITTSSIHDNPFINAITLEDLTDAVAPTMAVPLPIFTAYVGDTVQYTAHVNGTQPVTYQWAKQVGGTYVNIPGATNYILNLPNLSSSDFTNYQIIAVNTLGSVTNIGSVQNVLGPNSVIIGHWLSGAQSFADTSGFTPPGTHDGIITGSNYYWTNDVPTNKGGYSLHFGNANGDTAVLITNTWNSANDPGYQPTFDANIASSFTVALWAKGFPGNWSPWMSKYGENGEGWELRQHSSDNISCWTVRGTATADDLEASVASNDGQWHYYVGTFDVTQASQKIYVDGVLSAQGAVGSAMTTVPFEELIIGARSRGDGNSSTPATIDSYLSNASIYDARIYNYPLGPTQVSQLYSAVTAAPVLGVTRSGSNLVLTWPSGSVLLEATNLVGPWTTNVNSSPYTVTPTGPQKFFKALLP